MASRPKSKGDYFICPHCGAEVDKGASFCRECGSDRKTGWQEYPNVGADATSGYGEDDDFDYNEFVREEFPGHSRHSARRPIKRLLLIILVVLLCLSLIWLWI